MANPQMWQEIGRSLIAGGELSQKTHQTLQDEEAKRTTRQQQLEDMIQRRLEAKDASFRAQQEENRRQKEFEEKQRIIDAQERVRQKMLAEQQKKTEAAERAAQKSASQSSQYQQKADAAAQQMAEHLDRARAAQNIPSSGVEMSREARAEERRKIGESIDQSDYFRQITGRTPTQQPAPSAAPAPQQASPENVGEQQPTQEWDAERLSRESFAEGAMTPEEYRKALMDIEDRKPGGRYDKNAIPFEEKAQLEILKEDLRSGRQLTDYQKQLLELRRAELGVKVGSLGVRREGLDIQKERLNLAKDDDKRQDSSKLTSFVKNTKDQAEILYAFQKLDTLVPGGIYGSDGIAGYGFGTKPFRKFWKTEEANKLRPGIQSLVNKVLKQRSGAAVTEQELDRLETEFGINTTGTIEEFRQGLQNFYEGVKNDYDRFVTADQESARRVDRQGYGVIGNAPKVIQQQRPQQAPQPAGTWTDAKAKRLAELRAKRATGRLQ